MKSLTAFFLEASFLGSDAVRLEPRQSQDALYRYCHRSSFGNIDFDILDSVGQQLDADPPGIPRGCGWFAVSDQLAAGDLQPLFSLPVCAHGNATYLTTAFTVAGIGAFYLWRQRHVQHARVMFGMAMIMAIFVAPMQLLFGDLHGLNTFKHQPAKVAAMEGLWETRRGAPSGTFRLAGSGRRDH